jgi:prephenate dehydrogenase
MHAVRHCNTVATGHPMAGTTSEQLSVLTSPNPQWVLDCAGMPGLRLALPESVETTEDGQMTEMVSGGSCAAGAKAVPSVKFP